MAAIGFCCKPEVWVRGHCLRYQFRRVQGAPVSWALVGPVALRIIDRLGLELALSEDEATGAVPVAFVLFALVAEVHGRGHDSQGGTSPAGAMKIRLSMSNIQGRIVT